MLLGWDDEVWKVALNGFYTLAGTIVTGYFAYKLNSISKKQIENSGKIDVAAEKAAIAAKKAEMASLKVDAVDQKQSDHLASQDVKLEKIEKQTNGLIGEIKEQARKEGHESGEKAALAKLSGNPKVSEHT